MLPKASYDPQLPDNRSISNNTPKSQKYFLNTDSVRLRAIIGENKNGETVISYYSDRRGGSHNAQPINSSSSKIISNNIPKSQKCFLFGIISIERLK